ncbi:hypothetical protein DPMN_153798 [Dreissena polymorpha]|uniref:Uncharacterized protein n=1 Tax=Dreissena polymorpha TaxID=45954 RepID=A0A9D4FJ89_DREPO|nr:hypothetical protein DPMN_153798 [Dreissena polymorpha]
MEKTSERQLDHFTPPRCWSMNRKIDDRVQKPGDGKYPKQQDGKYAYDIPKPVYATYRYVYDIQKPVYATYRDMVTGSIPTVGAFFRSHPKTPSTGSRPRKRTRERFK